MPFGLGSIGNFFGGLGKSIGSGVVKGARKLGELRDEMGDGQPSPTFRQPSRFPMTPGFNPNASDPRQMFDRPAMRTMEARLPERPFGGAGHPPLSDFDAERGAMAGSIQPIRESVTISDTIRPGMVSAPNVPPLGEATGRIVPPMPRRGPAPAPMTPDLTAPMMSAPRDASFDRRQDVPIPGRPNRGGPVPYSDYEASKYDAWSRHAVRDEAGDFDPRGGTKRNWKSILQNALLGAAQQSEGGDIGRMLGGALGGGLGATINSQRGYENIWDAGHGRAMLQDQARRDTELDRQRKTRMGGLQEREAEANVGLKEAQRREIERREKQRRIGEATWGTFDQETGQPIWQRPVGQSPNAAPRRYNVNGTLVDETGKIVYQGQPKPMSMQDAESERAAEEGSVDKIAMDSYEGRGGDSYVISRMPAPLQQALKNPTQPDLSRLPAQYRQILASPPPVGDDEGMKLYTQAENARNQLVQQHQALVMQAQNEFQQMKAQELAGIRRYTEGAAKENAAKRRVGSASRPASGGSKPTARLSDLKKYLK